MSEANAFTQEVFRSLQSVGYEDVNTVPNDQAHIITFRRGKAFLLHVWVTDDSVRGASLFEMPPKDSTYARCQKVWSRSESEGDIRALWGALELCGSPVSPPVTSEEPVPDPEDIEDILRAAGWLD